MNTLMFESAPDIIAIANSYGHFTKVNQAFCDLLGYTEEELTSNPYTYFVHPDDLKKSEIEYVETISGNRKSNNFTNRYRTKNGDYKWISWSSSEIFGDENNAFSYGRNITEITELQHLFQETAKLAEIGSWEYYTNTQLPFFFLSSVVKDILELDRNENIDLETLLNFTYENDRKKTENAFYKLINRGKKFDIEFQIKIRRSR